MGVFVIEGRHKPVRALASPLDPSERLKTQKN
mgnify:FL=1|jgi:hypothetical protein